MPRTPHNESVTEVSLEALLTHLKSNLSAIKQFIAGYPESNLKLQMPYIALHHVNTVFEPAKMPYKVTPLGTITSSRAFVDWHLGDYALSMQLDMWARNKEERDDLTDEIFTALNPVVWPMGISLPMSDYYGVLCRYLYMSHEFGDGQESSQRDEWKVIFKIEANCSAIRRVYEYIIEELEQDTEVRQDYINQGE